MSFFAVRTISEPRLVGLFYVESLPHLVIEVAKAADTEDCEFLELPRGAIFWPGKEVSLPLKAELPLQQSSVTENWQETLQDTSLEWKSILTPADRVI